MKHKARFAWALFAILALSIAGFAQSGTYAIQNADIVTVSGNTISGGTIVIRDGLIESVGSSVNVPADATVIDAKGAKIYPGLIDSSTSLGLDTGNPRAAARGGANQDKSNSNYPVSLRAAVAAVDKISGSEAKFSAHRNAGITTALTSTSNRVFNGRSAVINLAGDDVSAMVLKPHFAQHVAYRVEGRGEFPSSLMGTFAALRQMFSDAKRLDMIKKMYAENPRGLKRPAADPDLEALIPVVKGEMPVVIYANTEREIIRALDIAKEYDLKLIIAGGREAGNVASRLKAQNVAVLLSLDWPMRTTAIDENSDPEPLSTLRLRVEAPKVPAKLKAAGVPFAFQSGSMKSIKDFVKNAKMAVDNGLSANDAIRAMTLSSAEILGLDNQIGSIEQGKIANLVVMSDDMFAKDSAVTHVFVDGKKFEMPKRPKKKPASKAGGESKTLNVAGKWDVTIDAPGQSIPLTFNFEQSGTTLTGTLVATDLGGSTPIRNGAVTDTGFTFDATVSFQGQDLEINVTGTVTGDNVEGSVGTAMGPVPFSGKKVPSSTKEGSNE